ncbi:MAG: NAD(P)/FAD-dependent oxidoreductase [Chthoniobacterales bacterium]
MASDPTSVLVVGGGPAGLRAAEVAVAAGARVIVCDAQRSVGRKFLIAGRGGLNLTHGEAVENFPARYGAEPERWRDLLREFGPDDLRAWATSLGVETYVGTSGRVFPRGQKAAGLLRAWVRRLRASGVQFRTGARLTALARESEGWRGEFQTDGDNVSIPADAIVLALGGASWPETGSDGTWPAILASYGVEVAPWQPANCGWTVDWPNELLARAEGLPLKNLMVRAGDESVSGELLITAHGLEGGAIYRLGRTLRSMTEPRIVIDFKPQLSAEVLRERASGASDPQELFRRWKLSAAAMALMDTVSPSDDKDLDRLIARVKNFALPLRGPRPVAEAISSAGGIRWSELDQTLMLRKLPSVFVAGEMIDWEAPTGGYLLQGCFATATRAGRSAANFSPLRREKMAGEM